MKNLKLKLGKETEITYQEAKELVRNTEAEYDFLRLNESTIDSEQDFETVQNRKYYVTKVAHKGTIEMKGTEYEHKTEVGVYFLEMTFDFRHPSNFALNINNISRKWRIAF
jgi:hypothetical protein